MSIDVGPKHVIRDLAPDRRRVIDRAIARGNQRDDLANARRDLSRVYNEYLVGIEVGDRLALAESTLYQLLKKEYAKPIDMRAA